jgi:uncharacterized protein (DUF1015 family)
MNIHPFRASLPSLERIFNSALFFAKSKHLYPVYYKNGYFNKKEPKALFIYRQRNVISSHIGIFAATHIQDYFDEKIVKHEETIASKEERMIKLFEERNGQIKPVLLTYPTVDEVAIFLKKIVETKTPFQSVEYKNATHDFWVLEEAEDYNYLVQLFEEKVEKAYIADGHHRAATLARYYNYTLNRLKVLPENSPYNYLFSAFFSTNELTIADYNRVVNVGEDFDKHQFLEALSPFAAVHLHFEPIKPTRKHEVVLIINKQFYQIVWKPEILAPINSQLEKLDVSLLNTHILSTVLKIADVRNDTNITYIGGDKGLEGVWEKVRKENSQKIGFLLYPISTEDFITIVDTEGVMPPKSTYFMPRIQNAFVNLMFD